MFLFRYFFNFDGRKKIKLFYAFILFFGVAQASEKKFAIRPHLQKGALNFTLTPKEVTKEAIRYQPNITNVVGTTLSYKAYSLSFGGALPLSDSQKRERGSTTYTNLQLRFVKKHWAIDFYWQKFKGFYVIEKMTPALVIKTMTGTDNNTYETLPNMREDSLGLNVSYVFEPNEFNIGNVYSQKDAIEAGGGSWIVMSSLSRFQIQNPGSIVPIRKQAEYGENATLSGVDLNTVSLLGGYGKAFVSDGWYFAPMVLAGLGIAYQEFNGVQNDSSFGPAARGYLTVAAGYNKKEYFFGISTSYDATLIAKDDITITPATYHVEAHGGYRF